MSNDESLDIDLNIYVRDDSAKTDLESINQSVQGATASAKELAQETQKVADAAETASTGFRKMQKEARQAAAVRQLGVAQAHNKDQLLKPNLSLEENVKLERQAELDRIEARTRIREEEEYQNSLSNTRYALYDVAAMYRQVGVAASAGLAAIVGTGAAFESAFVHVGRTADLPIDQLNVLRNQLVNLSTEIPVMFTDLSEIATLGGQMDIAGQHLAGFAENVAMFSATTDATIDQTAMGFGRIIQLTHSSQEDFGNLASSIYQVGISTVATESQILDMSQQLAAAGDMAGFSADEVVGLAGTLASLGVQTERARGSMERAFNAITNGVDFGGERLEMFGAISGLTAEEFADAWRNKPSEAFTRLIEGMGAAQAEGINFEAMLNSLGIHAVRDLDVFRRLAGNSEYLARSLDIAANAWDDGSKHAEAYAGVAETVAAKAKVLANTILAIFDSLNSNALIGGTLDVLQSFIGQVQKIIQFIDKIPLLGDAMGFVATGVLAATAAYALASAGVITFRASLMAMETAMYRSQKTNDQATLTLRGMIAEVNGAIGRLFGFRKELTQTAAATNQMSGGVAKATGSITALGNASGASAAKIGAAGRSMTLVGRAGSGLMALGRIAVPFAAITGAIYGLGFLADKLETAGSAARRNTLDWEGLGQALRDDTQHFLETGEAVNFIARETENSIFVAGEYITYEEAMATALRETNGDRERAIELIGEHAFALGDMQNQLMVEQLTQDTLLMEHLEKNREVLASLGLSVDDFYRAFQDGGAGAAEIVSVLSDEIQRLAAEAYGSAVLVDGITVPVHHLKVQMEDLEGLLGIFQVRAEELGISLEEYAMSAEYAGIINEVFGYSVEDIESQLYGMTDAMVEAGNTMFEAAMNTVQFEDTMYRLGEAIAINGETIDIYSAEGRANMQAIASAVSAASAAAGNDSQALANYLGAILNNVGFANGSLRSGFIEMLGQLTSTQTEWDSAVSAMDSYAGSAGRASFQAGHLAGSMRALNNAMGSGGGGGRGGGGRGGGGTAGAARRAAKGLRDVGDAAKDARKEVRTLTDYVSDLRKVMSSAFEFRWGLDKSTDAVKDQYESMKKGFADAAQSVKELKQQLKELRAEQKGFGAERSTLEYQLKVATDYGDDLRVAEIQAELAELAQKVSKNQDDQSKTSKDLADAQSEVKRDLSGTTKASRDQRSEVLNLLGAYQDQVEALAATGMSQSDLRRETGKLKREFEDQMRQMGYSTGEIEKYSRTFDDMLLIIQRVPRNITVKVTAKTDPAIKALREFDAMRLRDKTVNVRTNHSPSSAPRATPSRGGLSGGVGGGGRGGGLSGGGGGAPKPIKPKKNVTVGIEEAPFLVMPDPKALENQAREAAANMSGQFQRSIASAPPAELPAKPKLESGSVSNTLLDATSKALQLGGASLITKLLFPGNIANVLSDVGVSLSSGKTPIPTEVSDPKNKSKVRSNTNKYYGDYRVWMPSDVRDPKNKSKVRSNTNQYYGDYRVWMPADVRDPKNKSQIRSNTNQFYSSRPTNMPAQVRDPKNKSSVWSTAQYYFRTHDLSMPSHVLSPGNNYSVLSAVRSYFRDNPVKISASIGTVLARIGDKVVRVVSGYRSGGFTGRGPADQVAGEVHKGEYVFPKRDVDQRTGLPTMDALGRMMQGYASGSTGGGGSGTTFPGTMVVELSPVDRALLSEGGNTVVLIDGKQLAHSVNTANANSSQRGL